MENVWFWLGNIPVYWLGVFVVLSYLWFGFVVYRKGLEARYHEESVLDMIVLAGVCALVGGRLVYVVMNWNSFEESLVRVFMLMAYPGYHLLGVLIGLIFTVWLISKREEVKFFDSLDIVVLGLVAGSPFERLGRVVAGDTRIWMNLPVELFQAIILMILFIWLWKLEPEYRTIGWYKNRQTVAKSGFISGIGVGLMGTTLAVSSWWGNLRTEQLFLGIFMAIAGFLLLYFRSGRGFGERVVKLLKRGGA